jgi:hypothetical protein
MSVKPLIEIEETNKFDVKTILVFIPSSWKATIYNWEKAVTIGHQI